MSIIILLFIVRTRYFFIYIIYNVQPRWLLPRPENNSASLEESKKEFILFFPRGDAYCAQAEGAGKYAVTINPDMH
jgi:hypothetical protein